MSMQFASIAAPWPALREELRLHDGPADAEGQPTWTLHDPVRHRFLRIDWPTFEVLRHWWLGDAARIAEQIRQHTTLQLVAQDVAEVLELARREQLVQLQALPDDPLAKASAPRRAVHWLLHNYLFFRVPLVRPDRGLAAGLPLVRWLGTGGFAFATLLALLVGLYGALQQGERLQAQWLDLLSWQGALLYGLTLVGVKLAHELGHAFVARHHGCRVPTMGVAFMVLWPVAYTDTTEAWRLADGRARMRIAAAGVATELAIAAWATLAWSLLPDGALRTATFVLATMTWVSSVLINLSPFMRFDGYFLLCDALEMPNLHERSFAQARAWMRHALLGWAQPPAESFAPAARRALIAFAFATWAWRLALYLGIAWTVYAIGFKLLGVLLLVVELGFFIAAPVWRETAAWAKGRAEWRGQRRARWSLAGVALLMALALVPWRSSVSGAALVQPAQTLAVRLPAAAVIDSVDVQSGAPVRAGQVLLRASTPDISRQAAAAQAQIARLQQELSAASLGGEQQAQWASLQSELATARDQAAAVQEALARLQPVAPFDGVVVDLLPGLHAGGVSPPAQQVLMHLASGRDWSAVAYVDEATARSLQVGEKAGLVLDSSPLRRWPARVQSIAPQPSSLIAEPVLVRAHGGPIDAREAPGGWVPLQSAYRVVLVLDAPLTLAPRGWRGHVSLAGEADSMASRAWKLAHAAWVREAGF